MIGRSRGVPAVLTLALLATGPLAAQKPERIPTHPSQLRFPEGSIEVPLAEGLVHHLSNGTPVVVVEDRTLPLIQLTVALPAGSFLDPDGQPGLAELTGALVRRGGSLLRSADAVDETIDFLGAKIDSSAGATRSGMTLDALASNFDEAVAVFFELVSQPGFQNDRIESVRTNLLASLEARNDQPIEVMDREWEFLLFGERHFRARRMTAADVESLERGDLLAFHRRYWRPNRAVIAVSGAIEPARALQLIEPLVLDWEEALGGASEETLPWPPPEHRAPPAGVFLVEHSTPQAKVSIGQALPRLKDWGTRDGLALTVMNEILGGTSGQVSRINGRLRGREGLVYRALSQADAGPDEQGAFRIFLDAAPGNVVRSLEICLEEIDRIRAEPVGEGVLEIVRQELLSRLQLRFDSAHDTAGHFAEDLLLGRPHDYWHGYARRLRSITPEDVQKAARRFLRPEALTILVVGESAAVLSTPAGNRNLSRRLAGATVLEARDPLTLTPLTSPPEESVH